MHKVAVSVVAPSFVLLVDNQVIVDSFGLSTKRQLLLQQTREGRDNVYEATLKCINMAVNTIITST